MARVNARQVEKVAAYLKANPPKTNGLNFYSFKTGEGKEIVASDMYPALNHPQAINFFFFACMQQFGFWSDDGRGYKEPLYGIMDGKKVKGSDMIWKMCMKALLRDETIFDPVNLAAVHPDKFKEILSDDNGPYPFPDMRERLRLTREYGTWFVVNGTTPNKIVADANSFREHSPIAFRDSLAFVPGYREDGFEKKKLLLAMVLANRPERFLANTERFPWPPIVDYHLMRVALRLGIVDLDKDETQSSEARSFVSADEEDRIRQEIFMAVGALIDFSGLPMEVTK